ncbi:MAG: hypothetical protein JWP97_2150, partial [Labilithrix sp.]|nr:hypothetical protein [Labilithrix sp.]
MARRFRLAAGALAVTLAVLALAAGCADDEAAAPVAGDGGGEASLLADGAPPE